MTNANASGDLHARRFGSYARFSRTEETGEDGTAARRSAGDLDPGRDDAGQSGEPAIVTTPGRRQGAGDSRGAADVRAAASPLPEPSNVIPLPATLATPAVDLVTAGGVAQGMRATPPGRLDMVGEAAVTVEAVERRVVYQMPASVAELAARSAAIAAEARRLAAGDMRPEVATGGHASIVAAEPIEGALTAAGEDAEVLAEIGATARHEGSGAVALLDTANAHMPEAGGSSWRS